MNLNKLLFVDDNDSILNLFSDAFGNQYQIFCSNNAEEALQIIENENILVMCFDLNMPDTDGFTLCQKVRDNNQIALIHAITGFPSMYELSECRRVGFDDYFTKPPELSEIENCLERSFEKLNRWKNNN